MIGQFVRSVAGHDAGKIYVVVAEDKDFVTLSDGRLKTTDKPKIKNKKHIQAIKKNYDTELADKITGGDKAVNEAIKRAIKLFKQEEADVKS